ncbi:MAG: hypothetical protein KF825_14765 [Ferruginibacter sp.]|nr:hypothetical protein [Ferruginibacter sp.]
MAIIYLTYQQIDKLKWDACINTASNGLVYGYSFYLDAMAKNWDALVLDDYDAVMPLTYNRKYAVYYLYQPAFTACLGVFGNNITTKILNLFLHAIPGKFKYWDIYLNPGNLFALPDFNLYERKNFVLNLRNNYAEIFSNFKDNIKRNIRKSEKFGLLTNANCNIDDVIALANEQALAFASPGQDDYENFKRLYKLLYSKEKAKIYAVSNKENKLLAAAVFFFSHNRAYYILVGNHPDGKTLGASHALINAFIKDHAGQNLLLDFEGSDIPSLAYFYSSFAAAEEKYSAIKLNRLPAAIRWLKK